MDEDMENGNEIYNGDWYIIVLKDLKENLIKKYDYYNTDFDISVGNEPKVFIVDEYRYNKRKYSKIY